MSLMGKYIMLTLLSVSTATQTVPMIDANDIKCKVKVGVANYSYMPGKGQASREETGKTIIRNKTEEEALSQFFISEIGQGSWEDAQKACTGCDSSLPIIRNKAENEVLSQFLRKHSMTSLLWTAGKKTAESRWTWINQDNATTPPVIHGYGTAAMLTRELKYQVQDPQQKVYYVCQFKSDDPFCSNGTTQQIVLNNGCLNTTEVKDASWYEARNDCLESGGDLPVLDDGDIKKLKEAILWEYRTTTGTRINQLWLGLRTSSWTWNSNKTDDIKYTNWGNAVNLNLRDHDCIAIHGNNGKWAPVNCNTHHQFVCEKRGSATHPSSDSTTKTTKTAESPPIKTTKSTTASTRPSSSAIRSTTTSTRPPSVKTKSTRTSKRPSSSWIRSTTASERTPSLTTKLTRDSIRPTIKSTTTSKALFSSVTNSTTTAQLPPSSDYATDSMFASKYPEPEITVAIAIICIIIVIIILIILTFAIRNRRKSSNRTTGSPGSTAGPEQHLEKPRGDSSNGVYAEIPLATTSSTEDARNAHPGIVYASLDLGNAAKNSNLAPANKTYPQGDIYAQVNKPKTDDKPVNKTYPQGDIYAEVNKPKSDGKPVQSKIGPLGDIYAQVNHNTTQPSQEQRGGPIYDNL